MAGVGGTVHLVVLPNAEKFHTQLKEKVENKSKEVKAEVLVDPDMSKFHMEMDRAEQRIDELDGRRIQLYLDVNDDFATRAVEDFIQDAESETITKRMEMDTSEARDEMDDFRSDQVDESIKTFVEVDRFHADEEMDDFREKQAAKHITQSVVLEFDKVRDPKAGGLMGGGSKSGKRLMGVRNDVATEEGMLDAVNFLPRMLKNINSQLDIGIRQVYDSYFNLFSNLYRFASKPFIDFTTMAREAKTLGEFFKGVLSPVQKIGSGVKNLFSAIPKGLKAVRNGSAAIFRGLKKVPALLKEIVSLVTAPVRLAARGVKALVGFFGPGLVSALGKVRGGFVRLGHTLAGGFVDSVNFARLQLSNLASGFLSSINAMASGPVMGKITDFMRGLGGAAKYTMRNLGGLDFTQLRAQAAGLKVFVSGELAGIGLMIGKIGQAFRNVTSSIGGAWRKVANGISRVTLGLQMGLTRTFRGIGAGISKVFGGIVYAVRNTFAGLQNVLSKFTGGFRKVFGGLGSFITGVFGKAVSGVKAIFDGRLGRIITGFQMGVVRGFRKTMPMISGVFRGIAGVLGKVMGATLNNPLLYRGIQAVFRRVSTAAMGLSRILMGTFGKVAGVLFKSLLPALMAVGAGVMALGGQAVIGAVMALAGAFSAVAVGAALMLPAVLGAAGVAFGVLKMGLADVKTSLSAALSTESVEEFEEAIADAHPTVQNLARAMREFKPAIDAMKDTVQGNMLAGLDVGLRSAMNNLLPIFSEGAAKIATSWNRSLGGVLDELSSDRASSGLTAIMKGTEEMSIAMEPTLKNLVAAFGSLAEQGAKFLGPLGGWINGLSESFFGWAEGLKEIDETTGISKFDTLMESARVNAGYLGDIFSGLFGTLGNVLQAAAEGGAGLLGGMGEGLQGLQEATEKGTEGYASIVTFMESASAAASSLKQIMGPLLISIMSVGAILTDVATGAMPGIAIALTGLQIGLKELEPFAMAFGEAIGGVLEAFAPLLAALGATLGPILVGLAQGLEKIFEPMKVGGPFDGFYAKMVELGPMIGNSLLVVGEAVGKIFAALGPIAESALGLLEPLLPLFDLFAYWVGEIVVALIKMVEPFMLIRDEAVAGLLDALMPLVEVLGQGLLGVINALSPLMPMLGYAFSEIVKAVTPLIAPLTVLAEKLFLAVIDVIMMLMPVIPPLVALIIGLAQMIANNLIVVINALLEVWDNVWPKVAQILAFVINEIILPLVAWLVEKILWLADMIQTAYRDVIAPTLVLLGEIFAKILDGIIWVIDNIAKPGLDRLKDAFGKTVDGIKSVWEGLKKIFAVPIRFFLETVLNDGLIEGFNKIGPRLGLDPIARVDVGEVGNYHSGGVLPGFSPGKDNYTFIDPKTGTRIGLAGGEAIMRPEWTAAVGGPRAVERMNADARHGRLLKPEMHGRAHAARHQGGVLNLGDFAGGGVIGAMMNIVLQKYPMLTMTSGLDNRPGYHGRGLATDWSNGSGNTPAQLALANDIADTYPGSAQLIYAAPGWSRNIYEGGPAGAMDAGIYKTAQAGRHDHHVHWAMTTPPTMPFGGGVFEGGSDGGGGGSSFNPLRAVLNGIMSTFVDPIKNKISEFLPDNPFGLEMVMGAAGKLVDGFKSFFTEKIPEMLGFGSSVDLDGVTGPIVDQVQEVFARHGFTGAEWEAAKWIIQKESNWDPTAVNPSSGAFGLFQFNPMGGNTLAEYLPDRNPDPAVQADAGARYMRKRYGSPTAAKAWWEKHEWYDQGGLASGIGVMQKNVLNPERVLSPAQTKAFDAFVYGFMPELVRQFRNNPLDLQRHFARLTGEISRIHHELREGHIASTSEYMLSEFRRRANGETLADNPVDMRFDFGWFQRNQENLVENFGRATRRIGDAIADPDAYLEAEARARKQLEEEFEAAKEKADADAKAAEDEAKKAEDEAKREKEKAEDEAAASDEEREALKKQREEEAEARKEVADAEAEAAQKRTQEEEARIEAAKADGSFYYGYKTFDAEGGNPNTPERSREEDAFRSFMDSVGERTGLSETVSGIAKRFDMVRSIGEAAQTATPAWIAALNGDPSGLAYNVAVGTAQVRKNAVSGFQDLGPSALAGILEMAISGSNSNNAPFIGEVNTGLSEAQLIQTLEHYEGVRARKGTGTTRVR